MLRLELDIGEGATDSAASAPLAKSGLIIVNPPYVLIEEAHILMPYLAKLLARGAGGGYYCDWLTPPA